MNPFDQRWQKLAQQARRLPADIAAELPFGFTTRILARIEHSAAEPWADILSAFGLRAAVATTCFLLASVGFAFAEWHEFRIEPPSLEASITSELAWP